MTTSEALALRHGLFISSAAFSNTRASPIYSVCPLVRAIVRIPVASMISCDYSSITDAAFIHYVGIQQPLVPANPARLGVSRDCNVRLMLRPDTIARPARPGLLLPSLRCRCRHQTASDMTTWATVNSHDWSSTSRTNSLMGCAHKITLTT